MASCVHCGRPTPDETDEHEACVERSCAEAVGLTSGEILVDRELRKEKRLGVQHYVTGQHEARRALRSGSGVTVEGFEMAAELSYVDVMGHAVLVSCIRVKGTWEPVTLARAGQAHTWDPCIASKAGFELSEKMVETLRGVE